MSAFYKWAPSSFHKNNFFERQLHINLFYYYKYLISSKLYLIVLLQIVIKMENRLPRRLKIADTCIVRYYHHFYTGQRAKIPDSPVKYRTPGNPTRDPPKGRHTSRTPPPPICSRPSTNNPDKSPIYKFSLNCLRGFCPGGFVRGGFCPFPLLSEYICYNRKVNITLNFMFHMYD